MSKEKIKHNTEEAPFLLDGHIHTIACGHAYSTITEMAKAAKDKGLELICWTEHGPKITNGPSNTFFRNMRVISPEIEGVRVLRGVEANILNTEGEIDTRHDRPDMFEDHMEIISASLHGSTFRPEKIKDRKSKTQEEILDERIRQNTDALVAAAHNPVVDVLCHTGNPQFPINKEEVVKAAKETGTLIEINNSSFFVRKGSLENCIEIARLCKEYEVPIIVGTDAHWAGGVGDFDYASTVLELAEVPRELVINYEPDRLIELLEKKGKRLGHERKEDGLKYLEEYKKEHGLE